jgi:hypothetical protein
MLEVRITLEEFMDRVGIAECPLIVTARVAPRFSEPIPSQPENNEGAPVPVALDDDGNGGNVDTALVPRFSQSLDTTLQQETAANGKATLLFDLDESFDKVTQENSTAEDVKAYLEISASCAGLSRHLFLRDLALDPDDRFDTLLLFDPGKSIVGHTTDDSTRLWFQYHGDLTGTQKFECEIGETGSRSTRTEPVTLGDPLDANTGVLDVTGLRPNTEYRYRLWMYDPADDTAINGRVVTRGSFTTADSNPRQLTIAFGSCHKPAAGNNFGLRSAMNRWRAMANQDNYDLLILMGDQVYGDHIEEFWPSSTWHQRYRNRYDQLWQYQPMRQVLRRTPTYMILDDHEIADDFGTFLDDPERIRAGLDAYEVYQDAHNPVHRGDQKHFSLKRGFASFFFMDLRTQRGKDPAFPILGRTQWADMVRWASSPETRDADVIFLVSSVPLAFLPIDVLADMIDDATVKTGAVAGAIAGSSIAPGPGTIIGGIIGATVAKLGYEWAEEKAEEAFDLADQWVFEENRKDLKRVLNLIFDLANDVHEGGNGQQPRAVFVLAGDAHLGALHLICSDHRGRQRDHRINPFIFQLLSSSISEAPVSGNTTAIRLFNRLDPDINVTDSDFMDAACDAGTALSLDQSGEPITFGLGEHYATELLDLILERTFGRMTVERVGSGRRYRFYASIQGERTATTQLFELDLDRRPIKPKSLIGQILTTRGKITLLRVHEVNSKFGPPADQIDAEVIVQLDREPGRAFGFQLRAGNSEPAATEMLNLLRDAFNHDSSVRLEYVRTGLRNGRIIRALNNI